MIFELCCGSLEDAIIGDRYGASRIELNSSLFLGGITPSIGLVKTVLENVSIPVVLMVRPRGGGFKYSDYDYITMREDLKEFLRLNIEGIAFGFLNDNFEIDKKRTEEFVNLINNSGKKAVFHRAFDNVNNKEKTIEYLIDIGCNRILTSGGKSTVIDGKEMVRELQKNYGNQIEIVAGAGINHENIEKLILETNITQFHGSCKKWVEDKTSNSYVNYDYNNSFKGKYDMSSREELLEIVKIIEGYR